MIALVMFACVACGAAVGLVAAGLAASAARRDLEDELAALRARVEAERPYWQCTDLSQCARRAHVVEQSSVQVAERLRRRRVLRGGAA